MSVIKAKRHESKAEFVNNADEIYVETMGFLLRLSARYQRIFVDSTIDAAWKVLDHAECAQNIRVTDRISYETRKQHLLEVRSWVMTLDVHMSHIFRVIMLNPQGAFVTSEGRVKTSSESLKAIDKMADSLGLKIDKEKKLIEGLLRSDKERFDKITNNEQELSKEEKGEVANNLISG